MKTNKTRAKKLLLSLFAMLMPLLASAYFEVGGIYYNITSDIDKSVEVTSSIGTRYSGSITIPSTVTYKGVTYSVTSIGNSAFYRCGNLTSITLPEGVTNIGNSAFDECSSLTSIIIPRSVVSIGDFAFEECSLTSITIPESVTSIGDLSFYGCSSLTSIVVVKDNIVYDSRNGCNAIIETASNTLVTGCSATIIPNTVTSIGYYAFGHCSINSVTIPENVTCIGDCAFYRCDNLTSITLSEGVTSIEYSAFGKCSKLISVTIPRSVTSIGNSAFHGCDNLTEVIFNSNPQLGSLALPDNTIKLLGLTDFYAEDFNTTNSNTYSTITYHRELASGKYGTIMLPFSPDAESLENFAFYSLTSAENDMLIFDEVEAPQANTPYLFSLREGKSAIQITGGETTISSVITNPEEVNGWQMIGSFTNQTIATSEDADNYYYAYTSADNQLHKVTKTLNVKPYRAYFVTDTANPTQLAVRTRNGETTLIDAAEVEDFSTGKYYDLSGRRVENPTKGLYIVNGKKVIL